MVALRFYARRVSGSSLGLDDGACALALVSNPHETDRTICCGLDAETLKQLFVVALAVTLIAST